MDKNIVYGRIANFINLKVIGQKAKEIREEKGIEPSELTRDFFTKKELDRIEKLQIFTEILISQFEIYTFKELEEKINLYKFKNI
jgi:prolipoprotein diacylglyceryltransferase